MNPSFLFMICSEYHDVYSNITTVIARDFSEAFEDNNDYEYSMQGYMCLQALAGPVHPDAYISQRGKSCLPEPYQAPTFADLFKS